MCAHVSDPLSPRATSQTLTLARAVTVQLRVTDRLRMNLKLSTLVLAGTDLTGIRTLTWRRVVHRRCLVRIRSSAIVVRWRSAAVVLVLSVRGRGAVRLRELWLALERLLRWSAVTRVVSLLSTVISTAVSDARRHQRHCGNLDTSAAISV